MAGGCPALRFELRPEGVCFVDNGLVDELVAVD